MPNAKTIADCCKEMNASGEMSIECVGILYDAVKTMFGREVATNNELMKKVAAILEIE